MSDTVSVQEFVSAETVASGWKERNVIFISHGEVRLHLSNFLSGYGNINTEFVWCDMCTCMNKCSTDDQFLNVMDNSDNSDYQNIDFFSPQLM